MSTAMKLLASVILASIFLTIAGAIGVRLNTQINREEFKSESESLANTIKGGITPENNFEITVPNDCKLKFEGENIIAEINEVQHHYPAGVPVYGDDLEPGTHKLNFKENERGVTIYG